MLSLQDGALVRYGSTLADKHVTFDMLANAEVEDLQELGKKGNFVPLFF